MDTSPTGLVKALVPKIPLILSTALWHTLGLTSTSSKWDLRTELTIKILRSFLTGASTHSLGQQQAMSMRDPAIKGPMWISKTTLTAEDAGENNLLEALEQAINSLDDSVGKIPMPSLRNLEAEWTGYRAGVGGREPPPDITEDEKYDKLMKEVTSDMTILYFHGGAYYLMDPASHRPTVSNLARHTGGRGLSIRYRLAPQHPFPAALLDGLYAYLNLLYPHPSSRIPPTLAHHIVISGDSAGGGLSMSLLQLLLQLRRQSPTLLFRGQQVALELPAGVAAMSAWLDLTHSLPSGTQNGRYDYLPPPHLDPLSMYPPDDVWPTPQRRQSIYAPSTRAMLHPLASPVCARDWSGAPPVLLLAGEERLSDETAFVGRRIREQGGRCRVQLFEAMPHCFAQVLPWTAGGKKCFGTWTAFMTAVVRNENVPTGASFVLAKSLLESSVSLEDFYDGTLEDVLSGMQRLVEEAERSIVGSSAGSEGKTAPAEMDEGTAIAVMAKL